MWKCIFALLLFCTAALQANVNVLALAGSTREGSFNKKLALEAAEIAKQMGASVTYIELKNFPMPYYDEDLEASQGMPEKARELRKLMRQNQIIIIASPEYNCSLSAVLKNALDWASRSEQGGSSRDAFKGKLFLMMSTSPGSGGGKRGLVHLKSIIEDVGGTVLPVQIVVPNANQAFDQQGRLKDPVVRRQIQTVLQSAIH